jgi:hypothetical protein
LTVSAGQRVTITFPVTAQLVGLPGGQIVPNTAVITWSQGIVNVSTVTVTVEARKLYHLLIFKSWSE